jgi:apolipoprotein D and lipocalin family protein
MTQWSAKRQSAAGKKFKYERESKMTTRGWSRLFAAGAILAGVLKLSATAFRPMTVAPSIDLTRYAGKWYEIARLPNRFQRNCAGDTTATYTLRRDGKIDVLNRCREADGHVESASGTARRADAAGPNTKLKVSFFWPFSGDYWILDVDPDYRWAMVGEPGRKYLWILGREPRLDEHVVGRLLDRAKKEGYDLGGLIRTPQTATTADAR